MTLPAWRHARGVLPLGARTLVMGIVNVTPDSFSDGGLRLDPAAAIAAGRAMAAEGADVLDVGGESTRPGHLPVPAEEEAARVRPVVETLARDGGPPVSIDTSKAAVARAALDAGAAIVNDVWGFRRDPDLAAVAAHAGAGAVLMHNREVPDPSLDILDDLLRVLEASATLARRAGVAEGSIVLDPGIGFGKTPRQNLQALKAVPRLRSLGYPVLVGASRKSFIARLLDPAPGLGERLPGSLAAHVQAALAGAGIVRVHDVAPHVQALRVAEAVRDAGGAPSFMGGAA